MSKKHRSERKAQGGKLRSETNRTDGTNMHRETYFVFLATGLSRDLQSEGAVLVSEMTEPVLSGFRAAGSQIHNPQADKASNPTHLEYTSSIKKVLRTRN